MLGRGGGALARRWCALGFAFVFGTLVSAVGCGRGRAAPQADDRAETKSASANGEGEGEDQGGGPDFAGREFPLLLWAAYNVEHDYFDKARIDPAAQLRSAVEGLGLHTPEIFVVPRPGHLEVSVRAAKAVFELDDVTTLGLAAERLESILAFARRELELEGGPLHELEYAAINGLFAPLDPHTILLTPEEHADLGVRTKGQFGGIGAEIGEEVRRIRVIRVLPEMPAERAGVRGGDVILKIAGESTVNMSASEAQQLLRGPVGTSVEIQVSRGSEVLSFRLERAIIRIDSVSFERFPDGIAYLRISNFQEDTAVRVKAAIDAVASEGPIRGVVIDLRGNAGGLLVQATEVVDQLVTRGELVVVHSALGREVDAAEPSLVLPMDVGVVAIIDEESASAAEIVSGGIQALGRGIVLGRPSFGKGTVQMVRPASPYGRELALKLTIAEYRVAGDAQIQGRGVIPDVVLEPVDMTRIAGVVRYYDVERFERQRERYRSANLPSGKHDAGRAVLSPPPPALHYLRGPDPAVEDAIAKETLPAVLRDPEVQIAARLAGVLEGAASREQRDTRVRDAIDIFTQEQDQRIRGALAKDGIDWAAAPAHASTVALELSARVVNAGPIRAGKPFTLEIAIRNPGDATAYRVHAITDCVHDELDGIEVLIGTIAPGEVKRRRVELHVMSGHPSFTDAIGIDVHAGPIRESPVAQERVFFDVEGRAQPLLSFDVWIVDDPQRVDDAPRRPPDASAFGDTPFAVQGNGDGMLAPGERVLVSFAAHNEGPGVAPSVRGILRNLSGSQGLLEEGVFELGELRAGQSKRGSFGLTVSPEANLDIPLELELIVSDALVRTQTRDKLRLRVLGGASEGVRERRKVTAARDGITLFYGSHPGAGVAAVASQGTLLESVGVFDGYYGFDADGGRRVFASVDPSAWSSASPGSKPVALRMHPEDADPVDWRTTVRPPRIELLPFARQTAAGEVRIEGVATHPDGLRDVVVLVRPARGRWVERKIEYVAAPPGATSLPFSATVPLVEGGNRILVVARDATQVQRRVEGWVLRDPSFEGP